MHIIAKLHALETATVVILYAFRVDATYANVDRGRARQLSRILEQVMSKSITTPFLEGHWK